MEIVAAHPEEADALTAIAFAAKAHWGYPPSWIERWRGLLTITPDYVVAHPTFVAVVDGASVGFCALQMMSDEARLDHLWVLPAAMRRGVGRALFQHAEERARAGGAVRLLIVGDPHAEAFYTRMGGVVYGWQEAGMDGEVRYLPLLEKTLVARAAG